MRTILIIYIGLFVSCGQQRSSNENKAVTDIKSYLPAGQHEAEIIELKTSAREHELNRKLYEAVKKNWDWYVEESKKAKVLNHFIAYDKRLGLTETEYDEFLVSIKSGDKGEYVKSAAETVIINHDNNKISFHSTGQLAILNSVTFDLTKSIVSIEKCRLDKIDTLNVTDDKNGFKSSWKGYRWSFDAPKDEDQSNSNLRVVSLTIGKLARNKKTYVRVHTVKLTDIGPVDSQIQFEL